MSGISDEDSESGVASEAGEGEAESGLPDMGDGDGDGDGDESDTSDSSLPDMAATSGDDATGGFDPSMCEPGMVASGFVGGQLQCTSVDADARTAINDHCQLHLGWRDSCGACSLTPTKSGWAGGSCGLVAGTYSGCVPTLLGGVTQELIGINTGGTVDDNDKFYAGFDCRAPTAGNGMGPMCPTGQYVVGIDAMGEATCSDMATVAVAWASSSCDAYLGWIDGCANCPSTPSKWGRAGAVGCATGTGTNNSCATSTVDGRSVDLIGIATDGDVDDNDTFYLSVDCAASAPSVMSDVVEICPAGYFVTAIDMDGYLTCESAASFIADYARDSCYATLGWRDSCTACTTAPARWARSSVTGCGATSSTGARCLQHQLGGVPQWMASVGTDGDVDENDKFYAGFLCE